MLISLMGLAGCASLPIIDQKNGCRLLSTYVKGIKNTAAGNISFKRLDDQRLISWVTFIPRSSENTPLQRPSVILKLYRGEKAIDEIRIPKGYTHKYIDKQRVKTELVDTGILKRSLADSPLDLDESTDLVSQEIWPRPLNKATYWDLSEVACSFPLSQEEFQRIIKSDCLEILIQTHAQPIVLKLDGDHFEHLDKFQKICFKG